jgi:hypothetical protein
MTVTRLSTAATDAVRRTRDKKGLGNKRNLLVKGLRELAGRLGGVRSPLVEVRRRDH